ncbi:hypothetical protein MGAST_17600 [Mycobacterium gastri 'Wayne']|uniref:Uncharacterized protein n=1 Tax=Mycobacterium gastri TaxID=1777 RepID=A0A1X1V1S7_MYCGS|nr:hypothetical protein MGAST_17600 [Mycobacterium gastri 'Wayne']ORV62987.1 hypothetical protein AWC07_16730 [Mycobacterium gastri]
MIFGLAVAGFTGGSHRAYQLLRPSSAPPVGLHHVVIDRHIQVGQEGIEVCLHNCPSVPFSHILHKPARRECNHGGTARRVAAASAHSAQPVHTRRAVRNY